MFKVLDPNTLNLDPDSEFWPYLDLDPVICTHFEKDKNSLAEKNFLEKYIFFNIGIGRNFKSIEAFKGNFC